ncbi:MAG: 2-isopropylmalate synthase [Pseudomonadota bacterium]
MKKIFLIDATLREGNQAPGVRYSVKNSIEIAKSLEKLGVDVIEVGHPLASDAEFQRVKAIVGLNLSAKILAHARANRDDILAVKNSGASWIGIFSGLNSRVRAVSLSNRSEEEVMELIRASVIYAKELELFVRYTAEDASRTDINLLMRAFDVAISAGADRVCFSDSVGILEPAEVDRVIRLIKNKFPNTPLEVHFHNDRGLALANTLSAIDAGADWISCSINGVGERAGITDTLSIIANLHFRDSQNYPIPTPGLLQRVSKLVNAITRSSVLCRQPIVGKTIFVHTAKLHKDAVAKEQSSYAWMPPEKLGMKNVIDYKSLPENFSSLIIKPEIISAVELKYHRHGPGDRFVMIDERFVSDCRMYSIVRRIYNLSSNTPGHVDSHRHHVDSFFLFLSQTDDLAGLTVEVTLDTETFIVHSPACVFIPSGVDHSYRAIAGEGLFVNTVHSGEYNESLLEYDD